MRFALVTFLSISPSCLVTKAPYQFDDATMKHHHVLPFFACLFVTLLVFGAGLRCIYPLLLRVFVLGFEQGFEDSGFGRRTHMGGGG